MKPPNLFLLGRFGCLQWVFKKKGLYLYKANTQNYLSTYAVPMFESQFWYVIKNMSILLSFLKMIQEKRAQQSYQNLRQLLFELY